MKRLLASLGILLLSPAVRATPLLLYVGARPSVPHGIYLLRLDPVRGVLSEAVPVGEAPNPTFLAFDPGRRHLYVSGELAFDPPVKPAMGGITAYAIDPATGSLTWIDQRPTGGNSTTHLALDATGRSLLAANFDEGYVCALPVEPDGRLGPCSAWIEEHGPLGPNPVRQTQPHPHGVAVSPDNLRVYSCDLGLDRIFSYRLDSVHARLQPGEPPFAAAPPGSGPHHGAFSRDGRFLYVSNEMGSSVSVYACDPRTGALTLRQTISTIPAGYRGANTGAEIAIAPDQRTVYASNRGADTLAVFARDAADGRLRLRQSVACGGRIPRSFDLSRDGRWLVCANLGSDDLTVFRVEAATGRLIPLPGRAAVKKPFTVVFFN